MVFKQLTHHSQVCVIKYLKQLETILSPTFHNATFMIITKLYRNFILKLAIGQLSLQILIDIFR